MKISPKQADLLTVFASDPRVRTIPLHPPWIRRCSQSRLACPEGMLLYYTETPCKFSNLHKINSFWYFLGRLVTCLPSSITVPFATRHLLHKFGNIKLHEVIWQCEHGELGIALHPRALFTLKPICVGRKSSNSNLMKTPNSFHQTIAVELCGMLAVRKILFLGTHH